MKHSFRFAIIALLLLPLTVAAFDGSARERFAAGNRALDEGDYYTAIEQYKLSLELNERYVEPMKGLAESFFFLGEYEEALTYVRQAIPLARRDIDLAVLEGRVLVGMGEFTQAQTAFEMVLEKQPNNIDAWFGLAELDLAFGKMTQATERYRTALQVSPANRRALLSLVLVLDGMGRTDEAAVLLEEALTYYPRNPQVRFIAARHFSDMGDATLAEFHGLRALELDPGYRDAALLLSQIYLDTEQYSRAVTVLENLISLEREQALVWYGLGTAYRRLGRYDEAMNAFAFATRYQPDDEISRLSLEQLIIEQLDLSDSRRSRYAAYHLDMATAYEERNFLERALRSYRRALLIDPHSRDGRLAYAEVFRVQGYPRKYLNELRVLTDLGYDDESIRDSIEIQESLLADSVSANWGIDQYAIDRQEYLFDLGIGTADLRHIDASAEIGAYFRSILLHRERIRVNREVAVEQSYGEAFSRARASGSDFFLIIDLIESQRHFAAELSLYSSRTGTLLETMRVIRTGNNRVADTLQLLAADIDKLLPISGKIIDRQFDQALVDVGSREGIAVDDEFAIMKPDSVSPATSAIALDFEVEDALGTLRITAVDELIAEGTIEQSQFFDLVNIGDLTVPLREPEPNLPHEDSVAPATGSLYETVIQLR